jgi:hypothetical protein
MKNKIGYTVKVKSGDYIGVEGILINEDTVRPFNQNELLYQVVDDDICGLWYHDASNKYSNMGGVLSNGPISEYYFYISIPVNVLTTLLFPDKELSSDGRFYYV